MPWNTRWTSTPGLDQLGREPERLRRRVRVLEAAGVGDERDVERLRDRGRQLDVELGEQVAHDLAGRRRVRDDVVDRRRSASCRGGGRRRSTSGTPVEQLRGGTHPLRVRAVEREQHALGGVVRAARGAGRRAAGTRTRPGGAVWPARYMTLSLPSSSSASFAPRIEPSASPSGFSCVTRRKRSWARIASATAARSLVGVGFIVGRLGSEVVDQLRHAHSSLDRRIVFERQLRGPLQLQLAPDRRLEDAVRRRESACSVRSRCRSVPSTLT